VTWDRTKKDASMKMERGGRGDEVRPTVKKVFPQGRGEDAWVGGS